MFKIGVVPNKAQNTAKDADVCPLIRKLVLKPYQSHFSRQGTALAWLFMAGAIMKVYTRKSYRCSCHWLSGRLRAGGARRNLQKCFIGAPQVLPGIVSHVPYEQRICMRLLFISWFSWWTFSCKELLAWCKRARGFDVGNKANITRSIIAYTGTVPSLGFINIPTWNPV